MKRKWRLGVLLLLLSGSGADIGATAQKGKKGDTQAKGSGESLVRLTDDQAVDLAISEMLGGWQIGNVELLHKHYADDVMVVSGAWEPPLVGWANYLRAYQTQRERMRGGRLDRRNTYVHVKGNLAWATYQWEFAAEVDGKPAGAGGHTTLILEKRQDRWLIIHNHTSIVPEVRPLEPAAPGLPKPAAQ